MSIYEIYAAEEFIKVYRKLDNAEKNWIKKVRWNLKEKITGKLLHSNWLLEKKFKGKRLYFVVDEEKKKVLLVTYSSKKKQQEVINQIIGDKEELFNHLRTLGQT